MPLKKKWHVIAVQEAIEYLQHGCLMNHLYVTHFAGCAVFFFFYKDTFHSDIIVKSMYLHDNRNGVHQVVREGQSGWVPEAVISRASFRKTPRNGKSYFTRRSLCINNASAKERGIEKNLLPTVRNVMYQQQVDLVAGDLNGAAWRRQSCSDSRFTSSIEESFVNTKLPLPPGSTTLWEPGGVPGEWSDVCGFFKPLGCEHEWQVRMHEPSPSLTAHWVSRKRIKVEIMKFGSTSSTSTRDWSIAYPVKTNIVDQSRGRGTHRMTTAKKEGRTSK